MIRSPDRLLKDNFNRMMTVMQKGQETNRSRVNTQVLFQALR